MRILITVFFPVLSVASLKAQQTFTNPLLPSGADPWAIQQGGYYYYTNSTGNNLTIWKTKNIIDLKSAEKKVVWVPPAGKSYSKEIWAPELHFISNKWYLYFATGFISIAINKAKWMHG